MRLLLDANVVIWLLDNPERISASALQALLNTDNQLFVSTASLMEIVAKAATGRLTFDEESRRRTELFADWMPVTAEQAWRIGSLPPIHKDPFDRIIVAQALVEGMTLVTGDRLLLEYGVPILLA